MSDTKSINNPLQLSRRNFLKVMTGGIASTILLGATTKEVSALTQNSDIEQDTSDEAFENLMINDCLQREVTIPKIVKKVVPSGIFAQTVLCTLCPEKVSAVASKIDKSEEDEYIRGGREELCELPETGEMYSCSRRNIKTSKIADLDSELVIDVGCRKNDLKFSLDYLQMNTDTSTIFVDASFGKLPKAYRILGELLDCGDRAELLATYIEDLYYDIEERKNNIEKESNVFFARNELGITRHSDYSFQNEAIEFIGAVPVIVPDSSQNEEVDLNFIQEQNIDYVMFNNRDCFDSIINLEGSAYEIW